MSLPDPNLRDIHERMIDDYAEGFECRGDDPKKDPPPWVDDHDVMDEYADAEEEDDS